MAEFSISVHDVYNKTKVNLSVAGSVTIGVERLGRADERHARPRVNKLREFRHRREEDRLVLVYDGDS